jgi:hypothetical protein
MVPVERPTAVDVRPGRLRDFEGFEQRVERYTDGIDQHGIAACSRWEFRSFPADDEGSLWSPQSRSWRRP